MGAMHGAPCLPAAQSFRGIHGWAGSAGRPIVRTVRSSRLQASGGARGQLDSAPSDRGPFRGVERSDDAMAFPAQRDRSIKVGNSDSDAAQSAAPAPPVHSGPALRSTLARHASGRGAVRPRRAPQGAQSMGNGVYFLLLLNFGLFAAGTLRPAPRFLAALPLAHWAPRPWQWLTATVCHAGWEHLSANAFSLLVFGRVVEEEQGALGVLLTYAICGVGGCVATYLTAPAATVSLGASAAVFGLFVVATLSKIRPSPRAALEAVVLGSFVMRQIGNEISMVTARGGMRGVATLGGMQIGHVAHLAGAVAGALLVLLLASLPRGEDE